MRRRSSRRPPRPSSASTTRTSTSSASCARSATATSRSGSPTSSLAVYERAAEHARERGIILADTKFEFGLDDDGRLTLGDEVLTPDSSRFWPADGYERGATAAELRQAVRARLGVRARAGTRSPPAPAIPDEVVARTRELYAQAYERIAGEPLSAWLARTGAPAVETEPAREGARARQAQGGHPRPAGQGRSSGPAGARLRGRQPGARRPPDRARRGGSRAAAGDVRAAARPTR